MRILLITFSLLIALDLSASDATAQRKANGQVCIDSKTSFLVTRRKCKSPRFTAVTNTQVYPAQLELENEAFEISISNAGGSTNHTVTCPSGKFVTGGGVSILDNN